MHYKVVNLELWFQVLGSLVFKFFINTLEQKNLVILINYLLQVIY